MLKEKVAEVLDKIRPFLQRDGGDVQLIDVQENGVVKVKLVGACSGCPMSTMTLKNGIEAKLKKEVPVVTSVESLESYIRGVLYGTDNSMVSQDECHLFCSGRGIRCSDAFTAGRNRSLFACACPFKSSWLHANDDLWSRIPYTAEV